MRRFLAMGVALALIACSGTDVQVRDPWVRSAPPGAKAMAAYLVIEHRGHKPLQVTAVTSPWFGRAMIHQTVIENDVARMMHMGKLELVPGTDLHLEPGGRHIMLMAPNRPVTTGLEVPITLTLDDGRVLTVLAPVRAAR